MDIGTNNARIAVMVAHGLARQGQPRDLFCIDTVFDLNNEQAWKDNHTHAGPMTTGWPWIYETDFHDKVQARILNASGHLITPHLIGESALKAVPELAKPGVAFAFSDADSTMKWLVDGIVDSLAPKMVVGGIIGFHDFRSQFVAPHEAADRLVETGVFEEIEISWDDIQAAVDSIGGEDHRNSWHHNETARPMFVGAIRRV